MATVFAFMNLKGGVGKTVLTANIAREIVAQKPKDILLVDLDPQCSLSYLFDEWKDIARLEGKKTALEAIFPENGGPADLLKHTKNIYTDTSLFRRGKKGKIDLIRGSMEIYKVIATSGANERQHCIQSFRAFIEEASKQYDYIVVDTNPSTNIATLCALAACDVVVAPMKMDIFSVRGIVMLQEIFGDEYECLKKESKKIIGVWNMMDKKLRQTNVVSSIERSLHDANKDVFGMTVGPRIYETSYLHYREEKGFIHDFSRIRRRDFFNRAKKELSGVCTELLQRVEHAHA
jgi:cellulose biosynthesis protein BcsQ